MIYTSGRQSCFKCGESFQAPIFSTAPSLSMNARAEPWSTAAAMARDLRVRAVLEHFEEWHGGGPDAVEALTLLERIDAMAAASAHAGSSAPTADATDAARFRWLADNASRIEAGGDVLYGPHTVPLQTAVDAAMTAPSHSGSRTAVRSESALAGLADDRP